MHALLLDDEQIYIEVASNYLEALGASSIQSTTNPAEAADILRNEPIDLMLIDLNMPDQDGLSFLRTLSEIGFKGGVVIVSGEKSNIVGSAGQLGEKLGLSVCGALSKPLDINKLKQAYNAAQSLDLQHGYPLNEYKPVPQGLLTPTFYYQPQVDIESGELVGAEALLRGIDQRGTVFGPSRLLDACNTNLERFNLALRLYEIFCTDVSLFRRRGFTNQFSFNVDAASLEYPEFVSLLIETSERLGVDVSVITIELTESQLPSDESRLIEAIARLGIAGFEVSLDDFNTGASNYSLLKDGAFAEVKLDVGMVHKIATDPSTSKFISSVIEIARDLDLKVVAEGVETSEQLLRLREMGVRCIQGFYVAEPAPANELVQRYNLNTNASLMAS